MIAIYVRSQRAGERVMESITRLLTTQLKLKVNQAKSAVARPKDRKFLGFSFTSCKQARRRIAPKAILRFKERIRELTCRDTRDQHGAASATALAWMACLFRLLPDTLGAHPS